MRLIWTTPARRDIKAIVAYVGMRNPHAGKLVEEHIVKAIEKLADFPYLGRPGRVEATRELILTRYPCVVIYGVRADDIAVYRILHGAQAWPPDDADSRP